MSKTLGDSQVSTATDSPQKFHVLLCAEAPALSSGGAAKNHKADIYLTADMKYHELSDAVNEGLAVGLINHGEMERASIPELAHKISLGGFETQILDVKALPEPLRI